MKQTINNELAEMAVDFTIPNANSLKWQKLALELKEVWDVSKRKTAALR
jgi:hypothetical protein